MAHWFRRHGVFAAFALCSLFFVLFPQFDLWFSGLFVHTDPNIGFAHKDHPIADAIYWLVPRMAYLGGLVCVIGLVWGAITRYPKALGYRPALVFMLLFMLIGPGLLVNSVLKESVGRARPKDVIEYQGQQVFSPAFALSDQCETNCSFVSGHAAAGFIPLGLLWVTGRRRWLMIGIASGGVMGLIRVVQGGHFLSDVIFAFFVVYATGWVLNLLLSPRPKSETASSEFAN